MVGARGHDLCGSVSVETFVKKVKESGVSSVQLVPHISFGLVDDEACQGVERAGELLKKDGIDIALIGGYYNMLHQGEAVSGRERFLAYARCAGRMGGLLVGSETGSYNSDCSYNKRNHSEKAYSQICNEVKTLCAEAELWDAYVGIEAVYDHVIYSTARMKRLMDDVGSGRLKVIFDLVNLLRAETIKDQYKVMKSAFELYGSRMAVIHIKDCKVAHGKLEKTVVGDGLIDIECLLSYRKEYCPEASVIIEELTDNALGRSLIYVNNLMYQSMDDKICNYFNGR